MADAVIVGGGLAGSAVAIALAQAGRRVVLVEKEAAAHDKVCGEFLSYEACHYLNNLGIDLAALGAVPLSGVRLAHKGRAIEAKLPFKAMSLSRRILDEALLERALAVGATVQRGSRVKRLVSEPSAASVWRAQLDTGEAIEADAAFLATGKHDLKQVTRIGSQDDLIGFKMYWRLSPHQANELSGHVELALFPGGYAGLQPVEGGRANLCLLVQRSVFSELGSSWDRLLERIVRSNPHLAARLAGAMAQSTKPLAIAAIPYGYQYRSNDQCKLSEAWRLGDQAAVIPSFSGDGMSIALHSADLAQASYLKGESAEQFHAQLAASLRHQISRATLLSKALVNPMGQAAASTIAALLPSILTGTGRWTRIPAHALPAEISS